MSSNPKLRSSRSPESGARLLTRVLDRSSEASWTSPRRGVRSSTWVDDAGEALQTDQLGQRFEIGHCRGADRAPDCSEGDTP